MNVTSCARAVIYPFIRYKTAIVIAKDNNLFFANLELTKYTLIPSIIDKITVDIRFIPVYNFEVSGNHNYYVGINQILAHNKGRGGGGGRADRPRTRNVTKRAA